MVEVALLSCKLFYLLGYFVCILVCFDDDDFYPKERRAPKWLYDLVMAVSLLIWPTLIVLFFYKPRT